MGPDGGVVLGDGDDGIFVEGRAVEFDDDAGLDNHGRKQKDEDANGGWLENDDIEEF